jgi:hypothetical protein
VNKITESTLVPISLVIVFIGGILWLSTINAKVEASHSKLATIERAIIDIAEIKKDIEYIRNNLDKKDSAN